MSIYYAFHDSFLVLDKFPSSGKRWIPESTDRPDDGRDIFRHQPHVLLQTGLELLRAEKRKDRLTPEGFGIFKNKTF